LSVLGGRQRERRDLPAAFLDDDPAGHPLGEQGLGEVVVEIQPKETGTRICAFEVVPLVGSHEELTAVTGIVITVRAELGDELAGATIGALSRIAEIDGRSVGA
jgi:hypothetical protein